MTAPMDTNPRGFVVKQAFSDAYNYMKNGTLLRQVINKLNEIDFSSSQNAICLAISTNKSCATCKAPGMRVSSIPHVR